MVLAPIGGGWKPPALLREWRTSRAARAARGEKTTYGASRAVRRDAPKTGECRTYARAKIVIKALLTSFEKAR
jgi:hypothetical protein